MKLVYIHQFFTFPEGSGGTRSYDLAKAFAQKGVDVTIITGDASIDCPNRQGRWTFMERDGIKLWICHCKYSHKMSIKQRLMSWMKFAYFSSIKILSLKCDVVLATSLPLTVFVPGVIKKWTSKAKLIFEARDVWPESPIQNGIIKNKLAIILLRRVERFIYHKSNYVVTLSTGMRDDILSRVDVKNLEVIPNISEIDRFEHYEECEINFDFTGKRVILYAGTLGPVNDIMYVAKLANEVYKINKSICFLIIGDGKQKEEIVEWSDKVGILNKGIFFLPPVRKKDLPAIYAKCIMGSSFVWDFRTAWDNSANKFFDSLAAGKPILINHLGWQADVINEKKCGFVLKRNLTDNDIRDFVNYVTNDVLLIENGKNARKQAYEYCLPAAVDKYLSVFGKLVG